MSELIHFILKIDDHLAWICENYGTWTYALLFLIVFCETGLVVTPFLPGDSLLFAVGAFAARGSLNVWICFVVLFVAAVLGDTVNYALGRRLGRRVFKPGARFLKTEYLHKTEAFYAKYGAKAIVIARFIPIIRTVAPFVAGIGVMEYRRFFFYNVAGALLWIISLLAAGYFFGNLPFVKKNFEMVIIGIIFVSILPGIIEFLRAKMAKPDAASV